MRKACSMNIAGLGFVHRQSSDTRWMCVCGEWQQVVTYYEYSSTKTRRRSMIFEYVCSFTERYTKSHSPWTYVGLGTVPPFAPFARSTAALTHGKRCCMPLAPG